METLFEPPSFPLARLSGKGDQSGLPEATLRKKNTHYGQEALGHIIVSVLRGTG